MSGRLRTRAAMASAALVLATSLTTGSSAGGSQPVPEASAVVELAHQTPTVPEGGMFDMWLGVHNVAADATVSLTLHGRVRSRSEFAASMTSEALRGPIYDVTVSLDALPSEADGTRRLSLSLDPAVIGGVGLTSAGVYPVKIQIRDASGSVLAALVTHLLVRPGTTDAAPPLAVAVVARVDAPIARRADGSTHLSSGAVLAAAEVVAGLVASTTVPATLAVRAETLDALAASDDPTQASLLEQLPAAAARRSVVTLPYVPASPDELVAADLAEELEQHLARGRDTIAHTLHVQPSSTTWLAGPDLSPAGLAALHRRGVRHIVVNPDQVQPLRAGVLALSLAQPFLIKSDLEPAVDAMALDPTLISRPRKSPTPGLAVSRVLAELAMLWFEQPGIPRGAIVPVGPGDPSSVVAGILNGLVSSGMFHATSLDDLFASASALRQPGGRRVERALVAEKERSIKPSVANDIRATRRHLASFAGLVGEDAPAATTADAHLLLATARDLASPKRAEHLGAARVGMAVVERAITAPAHKTITLTARDGTVPLALGNSSGIPAHVVIHLRSPKLEFPDGTTIAATLTGPSTRFDISVQARASGTFPLEVVVTTPDGLVTLATVDYSVQSTAVSGVGLVLSIGAAIFLLIWWARHWRRTRRSAKLVAPTHPVHARR